MIRMTACGGLSFWERLVFYGLCGFAAEICFTATWDAIENGNRKLIGVTSMYVFVIYGFTIMVIEWMHFRLKDVVSLPLRAVLYVIVAYSLEFTSGLTLKQIGACPWDYASYFQNHFMGIVTAEYIPVWYLAVVFAEQYVIRTALTLRWTEINF